MKQQLRGDCGDLEDVRMKFEGEIKRGKRLTWLHCRRETQGGRSHLHDYHSYRGIDYLSECAYTLSGADISSL